MRYALIAALATFVAAPAAAQPLRESSAEVVAIAAEIEHRCGVTDLMATALTLAGMNGAPFDLMREADSRLIRAFQDSASRRADQTGTAEFCRQSQPFIQDFQRRKAALDVLSKP